MPVVCADSGVQNYLVCDNEAQMVHLVKPDVKSERSAWLDSSEVLIGPEHKVCLAKVADQVVVVVACRSQLTLASMETLSVQQMVSQSLLQGRL